MGEVSGNKSTIVQEPPAPVPTLNLLRHLTVIRIFISWILSGVETLLRAF